MKFVKSYEQGKLGVKFMRLGGGRGFPVGDTTAEYDISTSIITIVHA